MRLDWGAANNMDDTMVGSTAQPGALAHLVHPTGVLHASATAAAGPHKPTAGGLEAGCKSGGGGEGACAKHQGRPRPYPSYSSPHTATHTSTCSTSRTRW